MYGFVNRVVGEILRQVTDIEKSPLKCGGFNGLWDIGKSIEIAYKIRDHICLLNA